MYFFFFCRLKILEKIFEDCVLHFLSSRFLEIYFVFLFENLHS